MSYTSPTDFELRRPGSFLVAIIVLLAMLFCDTDFARTEPADVKHSAVPSTVRLSLEDAVVLFLKQNLDVLMVHYNIDLRTGQQITAKLFPNPVLQVGSGASFTQGNTITNSAVFTTLVQQLFELAGKRGYRIESAGYGTQSAEADFEDAVRQLTFAVKDAYYRVQVAQRRLALAEENRDRFTRIMEINTIRFRKGYIAEIDLIRLRLQVVDFHSQVILSVQEAESARSDVRQLLRLSPLSKLELTTELTFRRTDPDIDKLREIAFNVRPDLRGKQRILSQKRANLKLAKAYRYPDITLGGGYSVQGPRGPDIPQMGILNMSTPVPLFNRNQGGIVQAEAETQSAQADVNKTINQIENQVDVAYQNLVHSRRLVESYLGGILEDSGLAFTVAELAYQRGGITILDLLDAARTSRKIQQKYIEAIFTYQRNLIQLESAVGQKIS